MIITKYKLDNGIQVIEFISMADVNAFKAANPAWANINPIEFEEDIIGPSPVVPNEVPTWRLRAILAVNNLENAVTSALDQLSEPNKTIAKKAWDYGSNTERQSPTVDFIKGVLNLTDAQVDDIFVQAANIVI